METEIQMMKAILQSLLKIRFHKRHNLLSPDRSGNPGIALFDLSYFIVLFLAMPDWNGWQE